MSQQITVFQEIKKNTLFYIIKYRAVKVDKHFIG